MSKLTHVAIGRAQAPAGCSLEAEVPYVKSLQGSSPPSGGVCKRERQERMPKKKSHMLCHLLSEVTSHHFWGTPFISFI